MNNASIAPCGVICDLCLGFQRSKNKCAGCNNADNKPYHCTVCKLKWDKQESYLIFRAFLYIWNEKLSCEAGFSTKQCIAHAGLERITNP